MRSILAVAIAMLFGIAGCTKHRCPVFSSESVECQRLQRFLRNLEQPRVEEKTESVAFFGKDANEPIEDVSLAEFKESIFGVVGCCCSSPHPQANEWLEYHRLDCIRQNLEDEHVLRIAFYGSYGSMLDDKRTAPDEWQSWAEINDPQRIKEVLKFFYEAMDSETNRFANEDYVFSDIGRMQIITDKHKFIIPISAWNHAIRGIGWTSYELKQKLTQWGFSP
jgi:hypothetical protein